MEILQLPDATPLISIRMVFRTGAAFDPAGKAGCAWLTALMLSSGGTRNRTWAEILEAFFPMAVHVGASVGKEMTAFTMDTHHDNLDASYSLLREMLIFPGFREEDFERLRDDAVNWLEVYLSGQNDEELAKEALGIAIFRGHPYAHTNVGTIKSLRAMTLDDLRAFHRAQYTQHRLVIGIGGGYPEDFADRMKRDFSALPAEAVPLEPVGRPSEPTRTSALLIEKPARSVAISFGYPIEVVRGHADYAALLLAVSCLGQHRQSSGRLFQSMRQLRGLNYGDYAYIEHFPGGMYALEPAPNLVRRCQIFEVWIRPVERDKAHFALRLALHELERLITDGLTEEEFLRTRSFLSKYANLMIQTRSMELGYRIDSLVYGTEYYADYLRKELAALTRAKVNEAVRRHLRTERIVITMAGQGMAELREALASDAVSPVTYESPKTDALLAEDRAVAMRPLRIERGDITVMPVEDLFA